RWRSPTRSPAAWRRWPASADAQQATRVVLGEPPRGRGQPRPHRVVEPVPLPEAPRSLVAGAAHRHARVPGSHHATLRRAATAGAHGVAERAGHSLSVGVAHLITLIGYGYPPP